MKFLLCALLISFALADALAQNAPHSSNDETENTVTIDPVYYCSDCLTSPSRTQSPPKQFFQIEAASKPKKIGLRRFQRDLTRTLSNHGIWITNRVKGLVFEAVATEEAVDRFQGQASNFGLPRLTIRPSKDHQGMGVKLGTSLKEVLDDRQRNSEHIHVALITKTEPNDDLVAPWRTAEVSVTKIIEAVPLQVRIYDRFANLLWIEGLAEDMELLLRFPIADVDQAHLVEPTLKDALQKHADRTRRPFRPADVVAVMQGVE